MSILSVNYLCLYLYYCQHTPRSACVCFCVCLCNLETFFPVNTELHPHPDKFCTPTGDSYSFSAVFPRVFTMCTVSFGDCSEGSGWTRPQTVLIQLPTLRLDNSPWREGPEKWIRPRSAVFFAHRPPQTEQVAVLTAELRVKSQPCWSHPTDLHFSKWMTIIYLQLIRPFKFDVTPECFPRSVPYMWANQLWGISPEILRTLTVCLVAIEQTLHHHNYVEIKDQFQVYLGRCHGTFSPITQICTTHKTTPQQRKHCRSLTHEGKSESLLTSNKSVWIRSESKHIPAVIVKNLTQFLSEYTP